MSTGPSPYSTYAEEAFWSPAVGRKNALQISGLWKPKFEVKKTHVIATAGSCFAQHIGRALRSRGFAWHDSEPAREDLPQDRHADFNYGIFSFRTGNIYTVALLKQWIDWALDGVDPKGLEVWQDGDGRFIDPFRPNITPGGFESRAALIQARQVTFQAIREAIGKIDIFVFTLGLTEAWVNADTGHVYPMCPGTLAGTFDPGRHRFVNYQYPEIRQAIRSVIERVRDVNPSIRFLLTVSPVPLTATASGQHVLTATIHSKSVLRAVAGDVCQTRRDTDYFPSFEIISAFPFKGMFFEPNLRNVAPEGVDFVMRAFFDCQKAAFGSAGETDAFDNPDELDEEVCEEAMLDMLSDVSTEMPANAADRRLCLIGNSHLGVVRKAWQKGACNSFPDMTLSFFGASGRGFLSLSAESDAIRSTDEKVCDGFEKTSGGCREIAFENYDAFIVYGMGFPLKWMASQLEKLADGGVVQPDSLLMEQLRRRLVRAVENNPFVRLALAVRNASQKPVFIAMAPMWSVLMRQAEPAVYDKFCQHEQFFKDMHCDVLSEILSAKGIGLIVQAESTLESPCFTKEKYSMGYGSNVRDHGHMNVKYADFVVEQMMRGLKHIRAERGASTAA